VNSGYYSCGDEGTGQCVSCGWDHTKIPFDSMRNAITCLGRVCLDQSPLEASYHVLLSTDGLSDVAPVELEKTCWFRNPAKGQYIPCRALWAAEQQVMNGWNECLNFNAPPYALLAHNCRYYVMAVIKKFCDTNSHDPICAC
jgi:hypothetical protein